VRHLNGRDKLRPQSHSYCRNGGFTELRPLNGVDKLSSQFPFPFCKRLRHSVHTCAPLKRRRQAETQVPVPLLETAATFSSYLCASEKAGHKLSSQSQFRYRNRGNTEWLHICEPHKRPRQAEPPVHILATETAGTSSSYLCASVSPQSQSRYGRDTELLLPVCH
jgi:hypothetical protein